MLEVLDARSNMSMYRTYKVKAAWETRGKIKQSTDVFMVYAQKYETMSNGKTLVELMVSSIAYYDDKLITKDSSSVLCLTIVCDKFSYNDIGTMKELFSQLFNQYYYKTKLLSVDEFHQGC